MPKYEVWEYRTYAEIFYVEAKDEDEAEEIYTERGIKMRDSESSCSDVSVFPLEDAEWTVLTKETK